jgi:hypothetical protein
VHFKLVACEAFTREICACVVDTPHVIDLEFTTIDSHDRPDELRKAIQDKINTIENSGRHYDAILLCYGLCGNATAGLTARSTLLVIPRAHDCCTIILGSKKLFKRHFETCPSQSFFSRGHVEHDSGGHFHYEWFQGPHKLKGIYAAMYGEEHAEALLKTVLSPDTGKIVYVNIKPTQSNECIQRCRDKAEKEKKEYVQIEGSLSLIRDLLTGSWYPEDFLVVKPGKMISGVYDWETIIEAV